MANEVYQCVEAFVRRSQNRLGYKHQLHIQLFRNVDPFKIVAVDILGRSPKKTKENRFVVVKLDRYSSLTKLIWMKTTAAPQTATIFKYHSVILYGIPELVQPTIVQNRR